MALKELKLNFRTMNPLTA